MLALPVRASDEAPCGGEVSVSCACSGMIGLYKLLRLREGSRMTAGISVSINTAIRPSIDMTVYVSFVRAKLQSQLGCFV